MRYEDAVRLSKDLGLIDLFEEAEEQAVKLWKGSSSEDVDGRERAYREVRAIRALRSKISATLKKGNT